MLEIFLATKNQGKVDEIKAILKNLDINVLSFSDFPNLPETKEDGKTFKDNALKKAYDSLKYTNKMCLADDSGLEIEYLNGKPGIYSSRWGNSNSEKINKVLKLLKGVPKDKRSAKFVCVLVLIFPDGKLHIIREECRGEITLEPKGENGFGYDPIFLIPEYNKTFAELGSEIKNKISHRGKALKKMSKILKEILK
ncbi:MAG: XTP/dITP diphosphatase [Candidatus Caldatribacteriota bacterium]|nr:XTP/dITP diphosphatase [Candidatus Caldatribacteriota bacterium]